MDRRTFMELVAAGTVLPRGLGALERHPLQQTPRHPLHTMSAVSGDGLTLTAQVAPVQTAIGSIDAWTLNGTLPSPTIRARRGETLRIDLVNRLPEPTILHWHGLAVPEEADGHPRLAVDTGQGYSYEYRVLNRAGTYWYHPHPHLRTAFQTYRGIGGFLIVDDDEEDSYELPAEELELALVLQDKRTGGASPLDYAPRGMPDQMHGYLGNAAFVNGTPDATVDVRRTRYRLRLLNGSNARIFDVGLSDGGSLTVIGGDGGLLGAPVITDRIMLGPAERADIVVDFSGRPPGERIVLRSLSFDIPGGMMMGMGGGGRMGRGGRGGMRRGGGMRGMGMGGMGMGGSMQGTEMDLLEFVVQASSPDPGPPLPLRFSDVPSRGDVTGDTPRQTFTFQSMGMMGRPTHTINGLQFDMERVDARIPRLETQVWTFVNESEVPHPVHLHAGQCRVLSRTGGRGRVMPWETGFKDTVLVMPGERVDVVVRFVFAGLYLLHCHNLEHEDMDMMINFEVVD